MTFIKQKKLLTIVGRACVAIIAALVWSDADAHCLRRHHSHYYRLHHPCHHLHRHYPYHHRHPASHLSRDESALAPAAQVAPLAPDDVSWLFPAPNNEKELGAAIVLGDLTSADPVDPTKRSSILPESVFARFVANAEKEEGRVGDHKLILPPEAHDIKIWRVAGLRIDPGAPGLSPAVMGQFGQQPQLRFILQPVTIQNGVVTVADVAAHVIYHFVDAPGPMSAGCVLPPARPDLAAFQALARDFRALRDDLAAGRFGEKIRTHGGLLGVHPGLVDPVTAAPLREALIRLLEKHLSAQRLAGMAVMGLADNKAQPWMFMAMTMTPNGLTPIPGPTLNGQQLTEALELEADGKSLKVVPKPSTNNENPITCKFGPALPPAKRKGVATAELFDLGNDPQKNPIKKARVREVVRAIADPTRSHFFNTDCVSCHSETTRTLDLLPGESIAGVDPKALPKPSPFDHKTKWNVRNFGWSGSNAKEAAAATATRRTAAETKAVVDFINSHNLAR